MDYTGNISFDFRSGTLSIGLLCSIETAESTLQFCGPVFKRVHVVQVGKQERFSWLYPHSVMLSTFREFAALIAGFLKPDIERLVLDVYDVETTEVFTNIFNESVTKIAHQIARFSPLFIGAIQECYFPNIEVIYFQR